MPEFLRKCTQSRRITMQPSKLSQSTAQKSFFRFMCLGMIAILLAGAVFAAQTSSKVQAASSCVSLDDGLWTTAANWSCGHVPTSADDVTITNTFNYVEINSNQAVKSLTIDTTGTLIFTAPVTLSISGDFNVLGAMDPGNTPATGGTILLNGGNQTITTNDLDLVFYNLKKVGGGKTLSFNTGIGTIYITNNLILRGTATTPLVLNSTTSGTQWNIDAGPGRDLNFLNVQDSNNVGTLISVVNWTSLGNNLGWTPAAQETGVAITTPMNPSFFGSPLTLTVKTYPALVPGSVTFMEDGNPFTCLGEATSDVTVIDSAAICVISAPTAGSHAYSVTFFSSDENFTDSFSPIFVQNIVYGFFIPVVTR
jgi:hypothetical protein